MLEKLITVLITALLNVLQKRVQAGLKKNKAKKEYAQDLYEKQSKLVEAKENLDGCLRDQETCLKSIKAYEKQLKEKVKEFVTL